MTVYLITYLNPDNTVGTITIDDSVMTCYRDGLCLYTALAPPYTMYFQPWSRILRIQADNVGPPTTVR